MTALEFFAVVVGSALLGVFIGWGAAHDEVRTECQRQGSFYVGKADFECKPKGAAQ